MVLGQGAMMTPRTPRAGGRISSVDGSRSARKRLGFKALVERLESMVTAREGPWDLLKDQETCSALGIVCDEEIAANVVQYVVAGSPADFSHVQAGDKLLEVDGRAAMDIALVKGPVGSICRLKLERAGKPVDVPIARSSPVDVAQVSNSATVVFTCSFISFLPFCLVYHLTYASPMNDWAGESIQRGDSKLQRNSCVGTVACRQIACSERRARVGTRSSRLSSNRHNLEEE